MGLRLAFKVVSVVHQLSQDAAIQGIDAFAVQLKHSDSHHEALAKPFWAQ
jgi:hypothetical protein